MTNDASPAGAGAPEGATILIVDDDPGAAEVFEQILRIHGYGVRVAPDAEQGLQEIQRTIPAAILLDLHMPGADGLEFLRQLRANVPQARIPTAVLTGDYFVEEEIARELRTLDARVHFKPLWEEELLKLIHDLLETD